MSEADESGEPQAPIDPEFEAITKPLQGSDAALQLAHGSKVEAGCETPVAGDVGLPQGAPGAYDKVPTPGMPVRAAGKVDTEFDLGEPMYYELLVDHQKLRQRVAELEHTWATLGALARGHDNGRSEWAVIPIFLRRVVVATVIFIIVLIPAVVLDRLVFFLQPVVDQDEFFSLVCKFAAEAIVIADVILLLSFLAVTTFKQIREWCRGP
jgi:hypothetical protein